jgi:hypothetical protein
MAKLGGDGDVLAKRLQRFADELFIGERAIDLGRIEEGDAALARASPVRIKYTIAELFVGSST